MSGRRKPEYRRKSYETRKPGSNTGEPFVALYFSMLGSDAWRSLKPRAQMLYINMRAQFGNGKGELQEEQFYFNRALWKKTLKLYSNDASFYADRDELIEHGFIEVLECGKTMRSKSIYRYSNRWQEWKQERY